MKQRFSVLKNTKIFAIISTVCIITGLVSLILLPFGKNLFTLDLDFAGGTSMQFEMNQKVTSDIDDEVSALFEKATGKKSSSVQATGDKGTQVVIKSVDIDTTQRSAVIDAMQKKYNLTDDDVLSVENESASVGKDMQEAAVVASLLAVVLMLIYITIRFEFTSGLAAVTCLVHDLLVMLSVYVIFRIPLNTNFIAAALTILGYSINASIIVFDRVRENRKKARRESFADICEKGIWQTISRSINTTITTFIMVALLFAFGVDSIRNFTLPIMVGLISGAYSSIFLAAPLWNFYRKVFHKKKA